MIPILYPSTETAYTNNGLGRLADAISCTVEEERNGIYELTMEYPVGGRHFGQLLLSNIIYCRASQDTKMQAFRIYDVSDAIDGITTIKAQHISYQLTAIPVAPFTADDPADTVSALNDYAVTSVPFTIDTDVTTGEFALTEPMSIRAAIGGDSGILTEWGAEVEWDMYDVHILTARGQDRGKVVSYGKNITDITQEQNIEETITGIYPYYSSEDDYVDLPEKVILSPAAVLYPYPRIQPLDLSSNFNDTPTVAELRTKAQEYMSKAVLGIPRLSIDVSYVDDTDHATPVYLCDTVTVRFAPLGISTQAKVSRVVWDVLMDRYESVTIGVEFDSVANVIVSSEARAESSAKRNTTKQVKAATDRVTRETNDKIADVKYDYVRPYTINTAAIADTNTGDYLTFYFNLATGQDTLELHINAMMAFSNITSPCGTVSIIIEIDEVVVDSWDMTYCDAVDGVNTLLQYNRLLEEVGSGDHEMIVKLAAYGLDITPVADYNDAWVFAKKITPATPPDPRQTFINDLISRMKSARTAMSKPQLVNSFYVYLSESPQKNGPWSSVGYVHGYNWYANIQRNGQDTIIDEDFSLKYNDAFYCNRSANYGDPIKRTSCGRKGFKYLYKFVDENGSAPSVAEMTETVSDTNQLWAGPAVVATKPFYSARLVTNIPIFETSEEAEAYADFCDLYWASGSDEDLSNVRTYLENNVHLADWLVNE